MRKANGGRPVLRSALLSGILHLIAVSGAAAAAIDLVPVDFFVFEEGCDDCQRVREKALPGLAARHNGKYVLRNHDLFIVSNYLRLVAIQQKLGNNENAPVYMLVDDTSLLAGADAIEAGLCREVAAGIERRQARAAEFSGNQPVSAPVAAGAAGDADSDRSALAARFRSFTWGGVLLAGLVDSINPCAIATLVFFMSLLVSTGVRGIRLAAAGLAFAAGSYAMYFCLGIGLIHALRACMAWKWLRAALDVGMVMALVGLSILSFRDAWRYFRGHQAGDVLLQLPAGLKQRIHARLRGVTRARSLVIGGAAAGAIVTALESVCTGQVYLPTLVLIMREEGSGLAFKYLAGYNLMFIVPMLAILALVMGGLRTIELVAWSRRSVVTGKVLMGMLFIGMAVLVILL